MLQANADVSRRLLDQRHALLVVAVATVMGQSVDPLAGKVAQFFRGRDSGPVEPAFPSEQVSDRAVGLRGGRDFGEAGDGRGLVALQPGIEAERGSADRRAPGLGRCDESLGGAGQVGIDREGEPGARSRYRVAERGLHLLLARERRPALKRQRGGEGERQKVHAARLLESCSRPGKLPFAPVRTRKRLREKGP